MSTGVEVRTGGVVPVDKPGGPTSHDVVARARKAFGTRKIGHTGTLDPFASGLLLLCVGSATRLAEYLSGMDKTYDATAVLGTGTDTLDREGEVVERDEAWKELEEDEVRAALEGFVGGIRQVPPQYSAKKVGGEAMYRKARRGETVTLKAVAVRIDALDLLELDPPRLRFRMRCSSGTYVRALARDLGTSLGTCAHLTSLRRTRVGGFAVEDAVSLDGLDDPEGVEAAWIEPFGAVAHLPAVEVDESEAARLALGQAVEVDGSEAARLALGPAVQRNESDRPRSSPSVEEKEMAAVQSGQSVEENGDVREVPEDVPIAIHVGRTLVAIGERKGRLLEPKKVFLRV